MADALLELLLPHLNDSDIPPTGFKDGTTRAYLDRLTSLSTSALSTTEQDSLAHSAQSSLRSLQALSKRSHASITNSADHLNNLPNLINTVRTDTEGIHDTIRTLEKTSAEFEAKYERGTDNAVLDRRKQAEQLSRNAERLGNILELPSLLSSTVSTSAATDGSGTTAVTSSAALSGYASALDIHAHVRRLKALYPNSEIVAGVLQQADEEIADMLTVLITTLQSPNLKLAVAMRTTGWLRRVAPELSGYKAPALLNRTGTSAILQSSNEDGNLGSLYLVCRLATLRRTLEALDPLKQLADQETAKRQGTQRAGSGTWSGGMQSERYLKRFIELFREQSFSIISMYKSIFPSYLPTPDSNTRQEGDSKAETARDVDRSKAAASASDEPAPALAAFVPHLVDMLVDNLQTYMPNVSDRSSRDSLLSQVLFCAGSLGRLGADFSIALAVIEEDQIAEGDSLEEPEWVEVMKKHKVQASRLEVLASGVSTSRKSSMSIDALMQAKDVSAS